MKFFGGVGLRPGKNRLDFGGSADHDPDPWFLQEFLKGFFIYYRDPSRQPRIKCDSPGQSYLRNTTRHRQSENGIANYGHSDTGKLNSDYFGPQMAKNITGGHSLEDSQVSSIC